MTHDADFDDESMTLLLTAWWVGRQDSVGPAQPFFGSGGPQTGVWSTKTTKDGKCLSVIFIFW